MIPGRRAGHSRGSVRRLARAALDLLYVRQSQGYVVTDLANRSVFRAAALGGLALALGLTLSACGRRGPLDAPPGGEGFYPLQPSQVEVDAQGRPLAPPGQKKRIPLDVLLD
ncbi:MAG: hypothetical protein QOG38_243 [Hyphomicrobiales bacterium]|nr:hypothetical protein [Hyphomicrobiales bacterium]